ncbi:hypothetical protein AMTR_s00005p00268220 [Amborella trichopoda]|uniref:Uncharacterized protein n=1 Tax=Amborella trichopoda TaxID=13333 RepID=W1PH55_AMBTC|nr:hypothetical protein AMTR_s00005p00268220 [Amborella trichopoda]
MYLIGDAKSLVADAGPGHLKAQVELLKGLETRAEGSIFPGQSGLGGSWGFTKASIDGLGQAVFEDVCISRAGHQDHDLGGSVVQILHMVQD